MLNKNDPLIGAVQEVMKRNQAERDAARVVNEYFGIEDRKALPHEHQATWDVAYKTVLTEGVEALDEDIKPYKPTAGSDDPGYKRLMRQAHKAARSDMPQREFAKEYTGMGKHRKTIANTPLKHVHRLKVDKDGKAFLPMEESQSLDELRNFKNEKDVLKYVEKAREQIGKMNAYDTSPEGDEKMKTGAKRTRGLQMIIRKAKKSMKEEALGEENDIDHPNKRKLDVAKPFGNLTSADFKKLRSMKESDVTSPSSMNIKKPDYAPAGTTPDYAKDKEQTVNRRVKTSLPAGTIKEAVVNKIMKKLAEKKMTDAEKAEREKIVKSMKSSNWENRYPGRGKEVMYATATNQAMKEENEGFNNRHGLSVTASAEKQAVAEQTKARSDYGLGAIPAQRNAAQRRAQIDKSMEPVIDTVAPFIPGVGTAREVDKYSRGEQGLGQTAVNVGLNLAGGPIFKGLSKAYKWMRGGKNTIDAAKRVGAASASSGPKTRVRLKNNQTGQQQPAGTMAARAQQLANAGRQAQNARQSSQALGGLSKTVNATNAIRARQSSQALGGFGKVASGAGNLVKKYPKLAAGAAGGAALGGFAATQLGNIPARSIAATNQNNMAQKRAAAGDFLPAKPNTDRQNNDLNAMRVASRDTNQDRPASAKYKSEPKMRPDVDQAALSKMKQSNAKVAATNKAGPSFEKTGRGNAPSVSSAKTNVQPNLKPANVMSAKPSFEFSDKQREAAKKGKAGIKDVQAWAQSRGIKADPSSKEILRNYLNAAQNKTMKTDVKAGGTAATPTQTAAQSAELKMKAGMAQRSGPSVAAKPTPSATPNVQPARNSTLAAPSAMAAALVRKPATFGPK